MYFLFFIVSYGSFTLLLIFRPYLVLLMFIQASGLGGTVKQVDVGEKIEHMERQPDRILKIQFNADTSSTMQWHFKPQQTQVKV